MSNARVASRYVKSLLSLAVEKGVVEEVHNDMQMFNGICATNRDFTLMLRNPIIRHDKKRDILEKIFKGKVNPLTMSILDILTRKNREPILPEIAKEFHNAYNAYKSIEKATITTAIPLDAELRAEIISIVKKISDRSSVELVEKVDSEMIGGFVLNVNNKQVDASIKSKLKELKLQFQHNPYIKDF